MKIVKHQEKLQKGFRTIEGTRNVFPEVWKLGCGISLTYKKIFEASMKNFLNSHFHFLYMTYG